MDFDIIAAVNDEMILKENLLHSPVVSSGKVNVITERGHLSAVSAFNAGLKKASSDIAVFVHQDVYLPAGWLQNFKQAIADLAKRQTDWAVLGVFGRDKNKNYLGRVWSNGHNREFYFPVKGLVPVITLDEIIIIINRKSGITFDPHLPAFHLYGTDIVLTALSQNKSAFVFQAPVIHNSIPVRYLNAQFGMAYQYMANKWKDILPLTTCIIDVNSPRYPLFLSRMKSIKNILLNKKKKRKMHPHPDSIAANLGY